jgi:hypothetical protein
MKHEFRDGARAIALGASIVVGLMAPAAARDPGVGVGAPGAGVRDPHGSRSAEFR